MDARHFFTPLVSCLFWMPGPYVETAHAQTMAGSTLTHPLSQRLFNVERIWKFASVFDFDENDVNPAIIDMGFLEGKAVPAGRRECTISFAPGVSATDVDCAAPVYGEYHGVARLQDVHGVHGETVRNEIAGPVDAGGVAGQVATPNLYRLDDVHSYLYELYTAIGRAVDDGSALVNISGGFPCKIPVMGSEESEFDLCNDKGRAAFCASASAYQQLGVIASRICMQAANEGDIRQLVEDSVVYARDKGVPIVAAADHFSVNALASLAQGDNQTPPDLQRWDVLPATTNGVITVGGVSLPKSADGTLTQSAIQGKRINVWAPESTPGAASAFVSGLITLAQAINPRISRDNGSLDEEAVKQIPIIIGAWLEDTAYTLDELKSNNAIDGDGSIARLINPYRFIRKVAETAVPPFESLGYADSFDSAQANDSKGKTQDNPVVISLAANSNERQAGTIAYLPDTGTTADQTGREIDWFRLEYPKAAENAQYITDFELRFLNGYGDLEVTSPGGLINKTNEWVDGDERIVQYRSNGMLDGSSLIVAVNGVTAEDDNLYQLAMRQGGTIAAAADRFDNDGKNNNNTAQNATIISPRMVDALVLQYVSPTNAKIEVRDLNLHSVDDVDVFRLDGYPHPKGKVNYSVKYTIKATNANVGLEVFDADGKQKQLNINNELVLAGAQPLLVSATQSDRGVIEPYELHIAIDTEQY